MNSSNEIEKESNKIKLNNILKNLKSKHILEILFIILLKKKSLGIIKYNNIKDILNISIKDYTDIQKYIHQLK